MYKHQALSRLIQEAMESPVTSRAEVAMLALLNEIWEELMAIRQATESEAGEDSEPDPFQTLNGP